MSHVNTPFPIAYHCVTGTHLFDPLVPQLRISHPTPQTRSTRPITPPYRPIPRIDGPRDPQLALPAENGLERGIEHRA